MKELNCREKKFLKLAETKYLRELIYDQYSHFIPPENTRKLLVFWCFQGVENGKIAQKWFKKS